MTLTPPSDFTKDTYLDGTTGAIDLHAITPLSYIDSTHTIQVNTASATHSGVISTGTQQIAGQKEFTSSVSISGAVSSALHATTKAYVDNAVDYSMSWQPPIIKFFDFTPGDPTPIAITNRYIATATVGSFVKDYIYVVLSLSPTTYTEIDPHEGWSLWDTDTNATYIYDSTGTWNRFGLSLDHRDLSYCGTNTHSQLDSHLSTTTGNDPHSGQDLHTTGNPGFATVKSTNTTDCDPATGDAPLKTAGGLYAVKSIMVPSTTGSFQIYQDASNTGTITKSNLGGFNLAYHAEAYTPKFIINSYSEYAGNGRPATLEMNACNHTAAVGTATLTQSQAGILTITSAGSGTPEINTASTNILKVLNTTDNTSFTTGALVVSGGASIQKNARVGGATPSTSDTTGALIVSGGIGCAGVISAGSGIDIYSANNTSKMGITVADTTGLLTFTPNTSGAGYKFARNTSAGDITVESDTECSSIGTGSIITSGGISCAKQIRSTNTITCVSSGLGGRYVDGTYTTGPQGRFKYDVNNGLNIDCANNGAISLTAINSGSGTISIPYRPVSIADTTASSTDTTGALIVSGGIGCAGVLSLGGNLDLYSPDNANKITINCANTTGLTTFTPSLAGAGYSFAKTTSGGDVSIVSDTESTTLTTGALIVSGGLGLAKTLNARQVAATYASGNQISALYDASNGLTINCGASGAVALTATNTAVGTINFPYRPVSISDTTASSSKTTGALIVSGGISSSGRIWGVNMTCQTAPTAANDVVRLSDISSISSIDAIFLARFAATENADYALGDITGTLVGDASINAEDGAADFMGGTAAYITFVAASNVSQLTDAFSIRFRYTPGYDGAPVAQRTFFSLGKTTDLDNRIMMDHEPSSGELLVHIYDSTGTLVRLANCGTWSPTDATEYEFCLCLDFINATNSRLFIDGVLKGSAFDTACTRTNTINRFYLGQDAKYVDTTSDAYFRDLAIYSTVKFTSAYTPTTNYVDSLQTGIVVFDALYCENGAFFNNQINAPEIRSETLFCTTAPTTANEVVRYTDVDGSAPHTLSGGFWDGLSAYSSPDSSVYYSKQFNKMCCIHCTGASITMAGSSSTYFEEAIPAGYRPVSDYYFFISITDNTTEALGRVHFNTSQSIITITKEDGDVFANGHDIVIRAWTTSYFTS